VLFYYIIQFTQYKSGDLPEWAVFNPHKAGQLWRFLTYSIVHNRYDLCSLLTLHTNWALSQALPFVLQSDSPVAQHDRSCLFRASVGDDPWNNCDRLVARCFHLFRRVKYVASLPLSFFDP
jgi:hypothetical protein